MKTNIFNINYKELKNSKNINKETALFILDNILRFKFVIETKKPELFHEYNEDINNSLIFLGKVYEDKIKLDKKQNKDIMEDIIFKVHKNLEDITIDLTINEKKFSEWLRIQKNQ